MPFGVKLVFNGFIRADEMAKWVEDSKKALIGLAPGFGVFVDMRGLKTLPFDSQKELEKGQKNFKAKGMKRSVVILDNKVATLQLQRTAKETGIYEWERYIDASQTANWESIALAWIKDGIDPDKS